MRDYEVLYWSSSTRGLNKQIITSPSKKGSRRKFRLLHSHNKWINIKKIVMIGN